jgi:hypothetical protein
MNYIRPKSTHSLSPEEKRVLLKEYFDFYQKISIETPELLNIKLPRNVFDSLLDEIGGLILEKSNSFASSDNEISHFLKNNPLPEHLSQYLPLEYRVYCLALNALKQWVSAEQAATDRYIFGGTARQQYKGLGTHCLMSGKSTSECKIELHHPLRDGRPPIPLAKNVHDEIEKQSAVIEVDDQIMQIIYPIKRKNNRSWVMLKLGCKLLLGNSDTSKSKNVQDSSKTFARQASKASGLNYEELLKWINNNGLVE